jgi:hypothetical protein
MNTSVYDEIKPFRDDLIELFKKHGLVIVADSVRISSSPLLIDQYGQYRDITFEMKQVFLDDEAANKHAQEFGISISL